MLSAIDWRSLTRLPHKARLYGCETYFRESWADTIEVLGEDAAPVLWRTGLVLFKPDGIAGGKVGVVHGFLRDNGFSLVAVEELSWSSLLWRELWRYQLTTATVDRLAVNERLHVGPALLLVLRHDGELDVPASVDMNSRKGPSDPARQTPDCLRWLLGQQHRIFSYFHFADEPADIVRELGILLQSPARVRVLTALRRGRPSAADRAALEAALERDARSTWRFDIPAAVERAIEAVGRAGAPDTPELAHVTSDLRRMRRGERVAWRPFARALAASGVELDPLDWASLAAAVIVCDEPGRTKLIDSVDPALWRTPAS